MSLGKSDQAERIGVVSEAQWRGKQTPSFYTLNHIKTEKKSYAYKFLPVGVQKKEQKTDLGPATYNAMQSFKLVAGDEKPRMFVSNKEKESFLTLIQKKQKGRPSPGQYDVMKADKIVTKGLSKSYR